MCGIAGFLDKDAATASDDLRHTVAGMIETLRHRGPDGEGTWVNAEAGIALAHRRLSIIDLSPLGAQPMHSECGRYTLVFNGEIYNFRQLRAELKAVGFRFRGQSDTEVLLATINRFGIDGALRKLNGMFAFAFWDQEKQVLELVRDRFGEKPLYFGWSGNHFLFGSELKALKAHPKFRSSINVEALGCYLRYGYIPAPHCVYQGVQKLPPGHRLRVTKFAPRSEPIPYWRAQDVAEDGLASPYDGNERDAADELDSLLTDVVRSRMEADVPLGAFLSGGIDSSLIVAMMQKQSSRPVKTFTIGFREPGYDEATYARKVSDHLVTDHTELYVTADELLEVIPRIPLIYDEPFSDSSQIPTFVLSKLVRQFVSVSLSGDGGDELMGGYSRYHRAGRLWRAASICPDLCRSALGQTLSGVGSSRALGVLLGTRREIAVRRRLARLQMCMNFRQPDPMYKDLISCWADPAAVGFPAGEANTVLDSINGNLQLSNVLDRMMYFDTVMYLPDDILVKMDRASMAVSLESRMPFLDPELLAFCWRLPRSMKVKSGIGKHLFRSVLYRYVPQELVDRPKKGFTLPVGTWLRGRLKNWAEDLLNESALRSYGYLDPAAVWSRWQQHLKGEANWESQLWNVLVLQSWLSSQ